MAKDHSRNLFAAAQNRSAKLLVAVVIDGVQQQLSQASYRF